MEYFGGTSVYIYIYIRILYCIHKFIQTSDMGCTGFIMWQNISRNLLPMGLSLEFQVWVHVANLWRPANGNLKATRGPVLSGSLDD